MQREIQPTHIYSEGQYLQNNQNWHMEDSAYKASVVASMIDRNKVVWSNCADVGCGAGLVSELLAAKYTGIEFTGYELSEDARAFWVGRRQLSNLRYQAADILGSKEHFDVIVCLDVFEHIEDYFGFLRALRTKADKFVFNIPLDMSVIKLVTPGLKYAREAVGHIQYFNRYTALKTLEDCGYVVTDSRLAAAFLFTLPRNARQWLALPFRLASVLFGLRFASRWFGGVSLVVYATA